MTSPVIEGYSIGKSVELPFEQAVVRTREALQSEGFGVLCEIDVQATLKAKLGEEMESYLILGACNPPLAHRALMTEPDLGLLLPCNVVVYVREGRVWVKAIEPGRMLSVVGNPALDPVATEVRRRFERVLARLD